MLDMQEFCLLFTGINSGKPDNEILLTDCIGIVLDQQRLNLRVIAAPKHSGHRIPGVERFGKSWVIPEDATKPERLKPGTKKKLTSGIPVDTMKIQC